jgi:hypothetical protein
MSFYSCHFSLPNYKETYPYYSLPFCKPAHGIETKKRPSGIGEVLEGNELRNSGFKLYFKGLALFTFSSKTKLMNTFS